MPAQIEFVTVTHDFGRIPQGRPVRAEFHFTNTGNGPLIISKVASGSGSVVPSYSPSPVLPGGSGSIAVTCDADMAVPFNKSVTIYSNASTPLKALYVKGDVVQG
ncbi:DUF1573 domain-containing protein [Longispora sp. NPDC051575]|uniref:DUF1573 domain-containing protein n=1 Tax=Longispora sp. NPDC051575 TaxID=3154943 RepID=UPI003448FB1C